MTLAEFSGASRGRRATMFKPTLGLAFLRAGRLEMIFCWLCTILVAAIPAMLMVLTGRLVSSIAAVDGRAATRYALLFVGLSLAYSAVEAVLGVAEASLSLRFVVWAETRLAAATLAPNQIGQLESPRSRRRIDVAAENSREGVNLVAVASYFQTMQWRLSGIVAAGLLASYSLWSAPALLLGYLVLTWAFRRWLATVYGDLTESMELERRRPDYLRRVLTEPAAAKEIRIFGALPWLDTQFGESWTAAMRAVWKRRSAAMLPLALGIVALVVAHGLVFGWLALSGLAGSLAVGQIVVVVQAASGMEAISRYGDVGAQVARARKAVAYLDDLETEIGAEPRACRPRPALEQWHDPSAPAVVIDDLVFSYGEGGPRVLDHVDLLVPRGQTLAIVGSNGAGKSTLVKLMSGLYAPDAGEIRICGHVVSDGHLPPVGVVFQSFGRYELSIRDNVSLGLHGSPTSDSDIRRALSRAGGLEVLKECGLDTILSSGYPGGRDLSGGQWQRIALARALYAVDNGTQVLILDEPTAALDVRSECEIFEQFVRETRDTTTIIVSHRLNSVRMADRIVVLHQGRIVEDGTHDELIDRRGLYAEMFQTQARRFANFSGARHA